LKRTILNQTKLFQFNVKTICNDSVYWFGSIFLIFSTPSGTDGVVKMINRKSWWFFQHKVNQTSTN